MPCCTHDTNVSPFPSLGIDHEEGVALRLNALDDSLTRPCPPRLRIAEVGYVLMRALWMRFSDTSYLDFGHNGSFQTGTTLCSSSYAEVGRHRGQTGEVYFAENCLSPVSGPA